MSRDRSADARLAATLLASVLVALFLGFLSVRSGSELQPVPGAKFEMDEPTASGAAAP